MKIELYWKNKLYLTPCLHYLSMIKWNDDYETYDERFQNQWGSKGYILDHLRRVRPGPDMKTVDFGELYDTFRSNDETLLESLSWVFED